MQVDLQSEIKYLHEKLLERRQAFDYGMKNDLEFGALKKIFVEIKELEQRLSHCFEKTAHSENTEKKSRENSALNTGA